MNWVNKFKVVRSNFEISSKVHQFRHFLDRRETFIHRHNRYYPIYGARCFFETRILV